MNPADRPEFREIVPILKEFCSISVSDGSPSIKRVLGKIRFSVPTSGTKASQDLSSSVMAKLKRNMSAPELKKHDQEASLENWKGGMLSTMSKMKRSSSTKSIRKALSPQGKADADATIRVRSNSDFDVTARENRKRDVEQFASSARAISLNF